MFVRKAEQNSDRELRVKMRCGKNRDLEFQAAAQKRQSLCRFSGFCGENMKRRTQELTHTKCFLVDTERLKVCLLDVRLPGPSSPLGDEETDKGQTDPICIVTHGQEFQIRLTRGDIYSGKQE